MRECVCALNKWYKHFHIARTLSILLVILSIWTSSRMVLHHFIRKLDLHSSSFLSSSLFFTAITCFRIHPFRWYKIPLGRNNQNEISTWSTTYRSTTAYHLHIPLAHVSLRYSKVHLRCLNDKYRFEVKTSGFRTFIEIGIDSLVKSEYFDWYIRWSGINEGKVNVFLTKNRNMKRIGTENETSLSECNRLN